MSYSAMANTSLTNDSESPRRSLAKSMWAHTPAAPGTHDTGVALSGAPQKTIADLQAISRAILPKKAPELVSLI